MKNKVAALAAALSVLGGVIAAVPAMAEERTLFEDDFESCVVSDPVGAYGNLNGWTIYEGNPEGSSSLTVEGDDTNKYLTVKRTGGWLGAGRDITVQTGMTYNISVKIKSATTQKFKIDLAAADGRNEIVMNELGDIVESGDGWKTIRGTLNVPEEEPNTSYTTKLWIQTNYDGNYTNADYSIDDFKITYDDGKEYIYPLNETFDNADSVFGEAGTTPSIHKPYSPGNAEVSEGALRVTSRVDSWIGAGCNVALDAGYHYIMEFDVQDSSNQQFSYDVGAGARVNSVQQTAGTDDWEHCTAEIDVYYNEAGTYTTTIWIQSNAADDYTIDNIKIYRDKSATPTVGTAPSFVIDGEINVETKTGTGKHSDETATGFLATIKNTGEETGSFNTVNWTVKSNGETGKTGDKSITTVTLTENGTAQIALIVTGLDDAGATATVMVK